MAIQIKHPLLREFFEQLRFAPAHQKKKYFAAAEQLLEIIDRRQIYPMEFIVWRLTGYRPKSPRYEQAVVSGKELLEDLRIWLVQSSQKQAEPARQQAEPIWTVADLAKRFSVSDKTIRRWEKKGLTGRIYLFDDGKKRKGYAESTVARFERQHSDLINAAAAFSKVSAAEKNALLNAARQLAETGGCKTFHSLVKRLQRQTGRNRLTIEKILTSAPDMLDFLPKVCPRCSAKQAQQIYQLFRKGVSVSQLSERFGKTRPALYRIIADQYAQDIRQRPMEYIDSPDFAAPNAQDRFLAAPLETLTAAAGAPSAEQEKALFSRYNFLKYLAAQARRQLGKKPAIRQLKRIDALWSQSERVKQAILELYTPLAQRIAGRHASSGAPYAELVSDGMLALMSAVEKFDYLRGHRFSAFAGWAIAKYFARRLPAEAQRPDRAGRRDVERVLAQAPPLPSADAIEQAQKDLLAVIENQLDAREQFIIIHHFGLSRSVIRKKPMTLKEIGQRLDLTKERVRQIELVALHKLRRVLSPEQFEWLTR